MTITDRSAPGVRIVRFESLRATVGEPVDLRGRVLSLKYEDHDERADACTLELDNRDLSLFDREDLAGGTILGVSWGYPDAMCRTRRVVIRRMRGFARLSIECHGIATLFDRVPRTRRFEDRTASEVVREVATELGYEAAFVDVADTTERLDVITQSAETDVRFLARLAAHEGFIFRADDAGLAWRPSRREEPPSHELTYFAHDRGDVLDVSVETDLGRRVGRVTVRGRDPLTRTTIDAEATSDTVDRPTLGDVVEVVDPETGDSAIEERIATASVRSTSAPTQTAAEHEASARFRAAEQRAVRLKLVVVGDPTLTAARIVEVRGISQLLSGNYYVRSATHTVSGEGYTTELALRRDAVGRLARQLARTQGGTPNHATTPAPDAAADPEGAGSTTVEIVDPESGDGTIAYRTTDAAS